MEDTTLTGSEKHTIVDSFIIAMFSPKEYGKLLKLSMGKLVGYLAVLVLLISVIQYAIPTLGAIAGLGGMKDIILNEIPDFCFEDGELYLEEKYEVTDEVSGIYIIADTTVEQFTKADIPKNMMQAIMISKSNMLVYNGVYGLGGMIEDQQFDMLKDITISNKTVADASGIIYFLMFIIFVILYVTTVIQYLSMSLFYTAFMFLLAKNIMPDITFGMVYKVTLFAQTIGAIVEAITYCLNVELLIMAGSFFNVFVTVMLMNKVIFQSKVSQKL